MPSQSRTIVEPFPRHYRNMEIILAKRCKSLTGSFGQYYGYAIRRSGKKFFSVRSPKGPRLHDGHLRFIFACAELAREGLLLSDIRILGSELLAAATEAGLTFETIVADVEYNAHGILNIKKYYSL